MVNDKILIIQINSLALWGEKKKERLIEVISQGLKKMKAAKTIFRLRHQNPPEFMISMDCNILKQKMPRIMSGIENNSMQGSIEWIRCSSWKERQMTKGDNCIYLWRAKSNFVCIVLEGIKIKELVILKGKYLKTI